MYPRRRMPQEEKATTPERLQTDESLRSERAKADDAIGENPRSIDDTADAVINKARARADEVLATARAKSDRWGGVGAVAVRNAQAIEREREAEDRALEKERAGADATLRLERDEHAAILAKEREETDNDLSREREKSDRAVATRDEFLSIVSHDLRNMLSSVTGFATLIAEGLSQDQPAELQHARRIQRSGARMNRLVGDLVDVASIDAGMLAVTCDVLDPTQIVTEAVDTFQAQATAVGVALKAEIISPVPLVAFDPARILQVLTNFLSNALKFTPFGGNVVVRLERLDQDLCFAVSDTGAGVPEEKLEAIFERFLQVTHNDRRGVGLGLYISKCIVQGHGGRIWAESKAGGGSTFSFTIPLAMTADSGSPSRRQTPGAQLP